MKKLGEYIKWYFYITTSILLVTAVIFKIYNPETLPAIPFGRYYYRDF